MSVAMVEVGVRGDVQARSSACVVGTRTIRNRISDIGENSSMQTELGICAAMGSPRTLTNLGSAAWATARSEVVISHLKRQKGI